MCNFCTYQLLLTKKIYSSLMNLHTQIKNNSPSSDHLTHQKKFQENTQQQKLFSEPSLSQKILPHSWLMFFPLKTSLNISNNFFYQQPTSVKPNTTLVIRLNHFSKNPWFLFNQKLTLENSINRSRDQHKTCRH